MFGLPLAFSAPLVLGALALLPVLYYLLRLTPPRPRQIAFPPLKLILDLKPREETPARTPWWLLLLRLLLAALIILAMAGPIWNPRPSGSGGNGPLLVILDNGWPSARQWDRRIAAANDAVAGAARNGRTAALVAISDGTRAVAAADPAQTARRLRALRPVPWTPDRMTALAPIQTWLAANPRAEILWITGGLEAGNARAFAEGLRAAAGNDAAIRLLTAEGSPMAISGAVNNPSALEVTIRRPDNATSNTGTLKAYDLKGLSIGEQTFAFGGGREVKARFQLPIELRNEIARIQIDGENTAGAVTLLDSRWKRRRVAVISGATIDTAQPLLAPTYYLTRALRPFAEVREPRAGNRDPILVALEERPAVVVLADIGVVTKQAHEALKKFIEDGGMLVRFAGTRLAAASDDLVPVRLRRGGRVLGGALSWDKPRQLAPFPKASPFAGLPVPKEVSVIRQVLAEPEGGLDKKTWATLDDGTPLITAERRGKGMVVLYHVTADTTWSNLPLSGLFVETLRRTIAMAGESARGQDSGTSNEAGNNRAAEGQTAAPSRILDGFGALGEPPVTAKPVPVNFTGKPNADHPPGFYGPPEALIAVNTLNASDLLAKANLSGLNMQMQALQPKEPVDLRPWLVTLALLLFLADTLASLWLAGGLRRLGFGRRRTSGSTGSSAGKATAALIAGALILAPATFDRALAQGANGSGQPAASAPAKKSAAPKPLTDNELKAVLQTRIAYVVTGNAEVDRASRLGLRAVSNALGARTALTPGEPAGVNPARDDLSFYPLLYWPIVAGQKQPPTEAVTRLKAFMKNGGTVLFDTRDAPRNRPGATPTPETAWLRQLLSGVDVPELEPVPNDHVVTKTFYLLERIVGRHTVGQTWVEALPAASKDGTRRPARAGDSVSPIIITSNDLAAAWAVTDAGQPLYPISRGMDRQREFALRSGINLVMYTLTGNYKADQVHARDILERLGL